MAKNRRPAKGNRPYVRKRPWWSTPWTLAGAVVVVLLIVAGFLVWSGFSQPPPAPPNQGGQARVINEATHIPAGVYDQVPPASQTLKATGSTTVIKAADGKPEVLYIGAEWCPYCAAERWSIVAALSRFGTFSNLSLTTSSSTDTFPNTPTFAFNGSSFQSDVVHFTPVEEQDRNGKNLTQPTADQQKLMQTYDPGGSIPFVLVAGEYVGAGAGYPPDVLQGKTWSQVANDLSNPSSSSTKGIIGEANMLSAAICRVTNGQPATVCQSPAVQAASSKLSK
jgi:thiol-disulfide isomerase/thioredoxin